MVAHVQHPYEAPMQVQGQGAQPYEGPLRIQAHVQQPREGLPQLQAPEAAQRRIINVISGGSSLQFASARQQKAYVRRLHHVAAY